jgi:alkylation response protein AidB-like acyl-CoA dehydrogenase
VTDPSPPALAPVPTELTEYRIAFRHWLDTHAAEFDRGRAPTFAEHMVRGLALSRSLWRAGWKRVGWPESVGGLGGGPRHRATYYDELGRAGLELPNSDQSVEVMAPAMLEFAPLLAEALVPAFLAGEELWGQGFSEPDAGSDLAALRTRAAVADDGVVVDGQKVWTSHGHLADRLLTLVRTGTPESRHRGLAALLIDTDSPGISRNPLRFANGLEEMCETFFDDVRVPIGRMIGAPGDGWAIAMFMLQYERSMYAAQRQAWLALRLRQVAGYLDDVGGDSGIGTAIAAAWLQVQTVRARAIASVRRLEAGEVLGPEASADKVLLARAEQAVFEVARRAARSGFVVDPGAEIWRSDWWYSRACSIFGGSGEIQRTIIADRVLHLPRESEGR